MSIRDKFYKKYKRSHDYADLVHFRDLRKQIKTASRSNTINVIKSISNPVHLWSMLAQLNIINRNGKLATDFIPTDILAQYFSQTHSRHPSCTFQQVNEMLASYPISDHEKLIRF